MPKVTTESIQALLAPHRLKLTLVNGNLGITELIGSGLPPKVATLVFVAKIKPDGSVGRGHPHGYNLQTEMGLCDAHYKVLRDIAWTILQQTPKIDTRKSFTDQPDGSIDLCVRKLLKVHDELQAYKPFGNWAPRAIFQLLLRNKSGQANSSNRQLKQLQALIESGGKLPEPAIKSRKPRGRPRKNPAPTPEDTTTTTNEPTNPIQLPLESASLAAARLDDDGEVIDADIGDSDDMEISIRKTICDLSSISLNPDGPSNDQDEGEDDGGSFDMAQVAVVPASAPAPAPNTVPAPTAHALPPHPVFVRPAPAASATPLVTHAPAASTVVATPASAGAPVPPVPTAPAKPSLQPHTAASATPPADTVPLVNSSDSAPAPIIWRGLPISSVELTKLQKIAARRAAGGKDRFAKIYGDLINKLIEDPSYDPSSEPEPVPQVAAKKTASKAKAKGKAASVSEPGLEPNPNPGKDKGEAAPETTSAPVRRSGREPKNTKR